MTPLTLIAFGGMVVAVGIDPRWLVFFVAWRCRVLLIISGSMCLCRRDVVAGVSRDVGAGAEAG